MIPSSAQRRLWFLHRPEGPSAVTAASARAFDRSTDLPPAARLFGISEREHLLVLALHHIAGDGASTGPLSRDLSTTYAARRAGSAPAWEPLPSNTATTRCGQRDLLGAGDDPDSEISRQLRFWHDALHGLPEEPPLPADFPAPGTGVLPGWPRRPVQLDHASPSSTSTSSRPRSCPRADRSSAKG